MLRATLPMLAMVKGYQGGLSKKPRSHMCDEAPDLTIVKSGKCSDIAEECGHHITE